MSELSLAELNVQQNALWKKLNIELFGITAISLASTALIKESLAYDAETYWNGNECKLVQKILNPDDKMFKNKANFIQQSWQLTYNHTNNVIEASAGFIFDVSRTTDEGKEQYLPSGEVEEFVASLNSLDKDLRESIINSGTYQGLNFVYKRFACCYLPLVTESTYRLRNSEYALRTQAARNTFLMKKVNGVVSYKSWTYSNGKFNKGKNHFSTVNEYQYPYLNAILGEQVTEENFTKALDLMPEYDPNSVVYFSFYWFDEVEKLVLNASRRIINVKMNKSINFARLINSPRKYSSQELTDLCANLIIVKSKIKALEIRRSVLFPPPANWVKPFSFSDTTGVFDAFKTPTSGLSGRSRVLLDNVYVKDGLLNIDYEGKTYNQYDIVFGRIPEELKERSNLSALSRAPYNYINDAKRIMFCAKLRSQSVCVNGQVDNFSHEVPARVVFADFKGFSFGDSFVISHSFAKKLERECSHHFNIDRKIIRDYKIGQELTIEDLVELDGKNRFSSWKDIHITAKDIDGITVSARAPMGVGDKITNLHGSKGIVSLILPDEQMPKLVNDLSPEMKAGTVDIIIPGISVYRRKSTGQIFEAITRALNIPEMTLEKLQKQYGKQIKEYDEKCLFELNEKQFQAPCGINHFIRLDHDATSKQSFAYVRSNYNMNLRTAEMELLNLISRGEYGILNELDVRSLNKHTRPLHKIKKMQETGVANEESTNTPFLSNYFKYLGWSFKFNNKTNKADVMDYWEDLTSFVSDKEIDIF